MEAKAKLAAAKNKVLEKIGRNVYLFQDATLLGKLEATPDD